MYSGMTAEESNFTSTSNYPNEWAAANMGALKIRILLILSWKKNLLIFFLKK